PAGGQGLQFMLQAQGPAVAFELAHLLVPELALAAQFPALLFGHAGDADGGQFVLLPVEITGEPQAELAGIQPVGFTPALGIQADRADDQAAGAGRNQLIMLAVICFKSTSRPSLSTGFTGGLICGEFCVVMFMS